MKVEDEGAWVQPVRRNYLMGCCDCGLIHRVNFRINDGHIQLQMFRDNRRTAAARRRKGIRLGADHG